jgi:hypothetical protein
MYDVYEIGGAFDSDEYEATLQEFVNNAGKITQALKNAAETSPEDLARIAELVKESQAIGEKLENAKNEMSEAQQRRFLEAYKSLIDAVNEMK